MSPFVGKGSGTSSSCKNFRGSCEKRRYGEYFNNFLVNIHKHLNSILFQFIVTKVWGIHFRKVEEACLNSLKKLNLAYIDLYLVHWPIGLNYHNEYDTFPHKGNGEPDFDDIDYIEVWSEMEKLVKKGYCKSIGVSNFNSQQLDRLIKHCKIKPVCNQVECSPGVSQRKLINFASNLNLIVTAYCPLGHHIPSSKDPKYLYDKKVIEIAQKYGKSTAQVALRFTVSYITLCFYDLMSNKLNIACGTFGGVF